MTTTCVPGSNPGTEKEHEWENDESQLKPVVCLIELHQINFLLLKTVPWLCQMLMLGETA